MKPYNHESVIYPWGGWYTITPSGQEDVAVSDKVKLIVSA